MDQTTLTDVTALDIGPAPSTGLAAFDDRPEGSPSGAVVAGSAVAFTAGVGDQARRDVLQSLLLAQLAANAKAGRHTEPSAWFQAYRAVLEQTGWVVEQSTTLSRYLPQVSRWSVATVADDVLRGRADPDETAAVRVVLNALRVDATGASYVFECPSHSGGAGNLQVAVVTEEDGTVTVRLAELAFTAPEHVARVMTAEFTATARFQAAFLSLVRNDDVYDRVRDAVAAKVKGRFEASVAVLDLGGDS